nr:uncharacterized protein LOC118682007 isoform X1 [Bactrocera oleae]
MVPKLIKIMSATQNRIACHLNTASTFVNVDIKENLNLERVSRLLSYNFVTKPFDAPATCNLLRYTRRFQEASSEDSAVYTATVLCDDALLRALTLVGATTTTLRCFLPALV